MILGLAARGRKAFALFMLALLYLEMVLPQHLLAGSRDHIMPSAIKHKEGIIPRGFRVTAAPPVLTGAPVAGIPPEMENIDMGGPTQPENQAYASVNAGNMVDLYSGDFSYNIPLVDIGGYPIAIGYNSGISMDQEASWVGLGWNINPGTITRNMRGLPDDFSGEESVIKTHSVKENKTVGGTLGVDVEIVGFPISAGASIGIFHNTYKGWGLEQGINVGINSGAKAMGELTTGLSITTNSQEGLSTSANFTTATTKASALENGGYGGNLSVGLSYNSRTGMKALQLSAGLRQYETDNKRDQPRSLNNSFGSSISFANPSFTPAVSVPFTSSAFSFTAKVGTEWKVVHPSLFLSGYVTKQFIAEGDKRRQLPAYGYLHYQRAGSNRAVMLDFNREKDMPYREKPAVPHIAVPAYTYDVFSMSGEGTGGMFRAYRGDVGFVHDPFVRSRDRSNSGSVDLGLGDLFHLGVDIHLTRAYTETGAWTGQNPMAERLAFRNGNGQFEAAYFRNPGDKSVNPRFYYDRMGGDDVVAVGLSQAGSSSAVLSTTQYLNRYRNKRFVDTVQFPASGAYRPERDKRSQSISYLNAAEASNAGLSRYIDNYTENVFELVKCPTTQPGELDVAKRGLLGEYFQGMNFEALNFTRVDETVNFGDHSAFNTNIPAGGIPLGDNFSARWTGRILVPETGAYTFYTASDDGVRLFLNDSAVINDWTLHPNKLNSTTVQLVEGQIIKVKMEYNQAGGYVNANLYWQYGGNAREIIPLGQMYQPAADSFVVGQDIFSRENRINSFRRPGHISQLDVLNKDGRRYIYGIPVYNLKQTETSFSVAAEKGNDFSGKVSYQHGVDNTTANTLGNDHYFNSEELPAYAHSFLLTGILTPDYVDRTGDGISEDDPGEVIKFNYTKIAGIKNPYAWRTPYSDSANYNRSLRTDTRDDKGSYVYGEKELWYLHSIESRNMVATFKVSSRDDGLAIDEKGIKQHGKYARKLDEINVYVKADFKKYGTDAKPVKTVHFEYSYELCPGVNAPVNNKGKLTLKKIWFSHNGNKKGKRNPYVFHYNNQNPSYNGHSFDRWGNFKDASQNPGSAAGNQITNAEYPYALQDSALAAANAASWTLDSIVLPSGGRIRVAYESDDYAFVQNRRAMQMCRIAGFAAQQPEELGDLDKYLYGIRENLFVGVHVPTAVSSNREVFTRYLQGADTLFFKVAVKMPKDNYGSGYEYINCYAATKPGEYGFINDGKTIWFRLKAVNDKGRTDELLSVYHPLTKAALQFLRLNLPSKAYPGSDVGDGLDFGEGVKLLFSQADNIITAVHKFDHVARFRFWGREVDLNRSWVRLNQPDHKKYGGGIRVKRVTMYDYWNAMTHQKESVYGQEYKYTTTRIIDGISTEISSGVASYEPIMGGEENPWRKPIEYNEQVSLLAPVNQGYTEEPLGELLYPSPQVGYSKVRVRSIHSTKTRSASGFEETNFYTAYDFPVITDLSLLADGKKRFKPALANFLRINARHFVALSQGFKVELNDMCGKIRSQASYPETDPENPVSYTAYFYRVENQQSEFKRLNNTVMAISPDGTIDPQALMGMDMELMADMREQRSVSNAYNLGINGDFFTFFIPPVFLIPMALNLAQREETRYRSVGLTKVINRHGILDSIVVIDKGSRVTTRNLLFDAETGDPVLTSTHNEHRDPIYSFVFPAAWAYDGMSGAYKNISLELRNVDMRNGKIISGLPAALQPAYFASGDEVLVASREKVKDLEACSLIPATWPTHSILHAVDANMMNGTTPDIVFVDGKGQPYTGNNMDIKIIRSGRRNLSVGAGSLTMLKNPLMENNGIWSLALNDAANVIAASAVEYNQFWKVQDARLRFTDYDCVSMDYAEWGGDTCKPVLTYYSNYQMSAKYVKNNCGAGFVPDTVTYTIEAGMYFSNTSQAAADSLARLDLQTNGQSYANMNGRCKPWFYSRPRNGEFKRNNCPAGGEPDTVYHSQAFGADSSLISQAKADSLANIRFLANGQAKANTIGICRYYNDHFYEHFYKECPEGDYDGPYEYTAPAGKFFSTVSKFDAYMMAWNAGQAFADANGQCSLGGSVSVTCSQEVCEGGMGAPEIVFNFNAPTSQAVTLLVGMEIYEWGGTGNQYVFGNSLVGKGSGWLGYTPDREAPMVIHIPAGVTTYTVSGDIWQSGYNLVNDPLKQHTWKCNNCLYNYDKMYFQFEGSPGVYPNFYSISGPQIENLR